jgi:hypothetical protein
MRLSERRDSRGAVLVVVEECSRALGPVRVDPRNAAMIPSGRVIDEVGKT